MHRSFGSGLCAMLRRCFFGMVAVGGFSLLSVTCTFAAGTRDYPVGAGDLLQVVIYGEDNVSNVLSGRFRVEPDGSIYYPLLGKLDVAGKSPVEIAKLLGEALSKQVPVSLPTVSVAEFAPVFLIGDVARTGPFQFQPDMTVFQLVLQAGGISQAGVSEAARISLQQDVQTLALNNYSLRVQRARLTAEIRHEPFDSSAVTGAPNAEAASIASAESAIFEEHQRTQESREGTYEAQKAGYEQEISSIEQSIVLHDEGVRLLEEQVNVQQGLTDRGLAAQSNLRDLKRQLFATRREALEFRTALFRAKQNRIAVDRDLAEAQNRVDTDNVEKLRDVDLALQQNEIALAAAQAKFDQFDTSRDAAQDALGRVPQYVLIRLVDGAYASTIVDENSKLERGDIIRVAFDDTRDKPAANGAAPPADAQKAAELSN
jgi:polysaccharide biosynthesis/export protein